MSTYDYEYEWDSKYCYPHSTVLRNKLNITDDAALKLAEREITSVRIAFVRDNPLNGNFDLAHLRDIHYAIFHDIYSWAGQLRTVNISKGNQFCLCQHIEAYGGDIFSRLRHEEFLANKSPGEMPERLAYYLSEINALHPFREGNGRVQRVFIEYLAQSAGFYVDFSQVTACEMIEASALSFCHDYELMNSIFRKCLSSISAQDQQLFRRKMNID